MARPFTPAAVVKQRGMYTDLDTEVGSSAESIMRGPEAELNARARAFQSNTLPKASTFDQSKSSIHIPRPPSSSRSGRSLDPKVQRPFIAPTGEVPRKIEIERRKREFSGKDISQILIDNGLTPTMLLPCGPYANSSTDIHASAIPLEYFDNTEYDVRTPTDWVTLGATTDGSICLPARVFSCFDAASPYTWLDATVTGYDATSGAFDVALSKTNTRVQLPRVLVMFQAEDPEIFAKRVIAAHNSREEMEGLLRYHLAVDCMPPDPHQAMDSDSLRRLVKAALPRGVPASNSTKLQAEVRLEYSRAMNKLAFDSLTRQFPGTYDDVIPAESTPDLPVPLPIVVPAYDYNGQKEHFNAQAFVIHSAIVACLASVHNECDRVMALSLFNSSITKCVRLDEFQLLQSQAADQVQGYLRNTWQGACKLAVVNGLQSLGKGWFNLQEKSQEVYDISKLKKFMRMVKYIMQDTLYSLVKDSLTALTLMVERASEPLNSLSRNRPAFSLFALDLTVDFKRGCVEFTTPLGPFEEAVLSCFDDGLNRSKGMLDIEPLIMSQMFWVGTPTLQTVHPAESWVVALRARVRKCMQMSMAPLTEFLASYAKYESLITLDVNQYLADFAAQERDAADVKKECDVHFAARAEIEASIPMSLTVGVFNINCEQVRSVLSEKRRTLAMAVLDLLGKKLRSQADEVCNAFADMMARLHQRPNGIEDLTEQREFMKQVPENTSQLQSKIARALSDWDLLEEFKCNMSDDDSAVRWACYGWPLKVQKEMDAAHEVMAADENRFKDNLGTDQKSFAERIASLQMIVAGFSQNTDIKRCEAVAVEVRKVAKQLKDAQVDAQTYNNRERLFGQDPTDYEPLNRTVREFEPFKNLWLTTDDWLRSHRLWMSDSFLSLDPEALETNINTAYKTIVKCIKAFKDLPGCLAVAQEVKGMIEEFHPFVPLIQGLRNPGMRERHWLQLSEKLGFNVQPDESFTFSRCLEMRLQDHIEVIAKVGEVAGKEFAIEQALDKMEHEWVSVALELVPYKESGTFILRTADEISQLLDDHIVMTQAMSFSPFKKPFEARILSWENKLRVTQDVIEEWLVCQKNWLYLEPIFSSEDIARQLPTESKRYQNMDRMWRKSMENAHKSPSVIGFCSNITLLQTFKECNKLLDQVQKGLSAYLETKRGVFPRFYFLSDDELLEILSQTKDPMAVQPHMRKCFDNIVKLKFEPDMRMSEFISAENESVPFREQLYPKGNVEDWLLEVERVMRVSLREIFDEAVTAYSTMPRTQWVLSYPGQIVIAGCQTYWTTEVTEAIEAGEGGLPGYYDTMVKQLSDLVGLVRGDLTPIERDILSALIVIEVHARDVVGKLTEAKVSQATDFEWISQLRYYWEEDSSNTLDLRVKAVNAVFTYGYEYLGNSGRLVITPLTDRCYLTLTGALALFFGGAPAGPAGTGKTETTKDLGKAMAVQCVVFNCSDQLDYLAMGKFFKGLASAGAWACFDEFNRIDIEVLSVVAQQVSTIQQAIRNREKRFMFEGVDLALKWACAVFITMNPGYAGRTELPDNLAALFRPVAMMVPDYTMIAEIMLYSYGFGDAKLLAKKITTVFKLSSEQLSSQEHYDFGMRAVKTVICAAGNLKRAFPDMQEEIIVLRAIRDVNVPKFLVDDLKLFTGIVSDLFPRIKMPEISYGNLEDSIRSACAQQQLQPVAGFVTKVIQLYETTVVRHGLMLVGPTGSGKTRCYEVLAAALTALDGQKADDGSLYTPVNYFVLNPKSITMGQLYGEFDPLTHEWTDGILSNLIRSGIGAHNENKKWYVFDGPVDAVWIENMNTVLDDNKKLCLASGEIMKLTKEMRMVFEVEDLAVASPATVSRCGMVYLEPSILGLAPFVTSWLDNKLPEHLQAHRARFQSLFDAFLEDSVRLVRKEVREIVGSVDSNLCFSLLRLLDCFVSPYGHHEGRTIPSVYIDALPDLIEPWFVFALVWSVGCTGDSDGRKTFDAYLRKAMATHKMTLPFPADGLVYDYRLTDDGNWTTKDLEGGDELKPLTVAWKKWIDFIPAFTIDPRDDFASIIVPTIDTQRYSHLVEMLVNNNKQVLCAGATGTAKTLIISDKLLRYMSAKFLANFMTFSARTSANQTQDVIDSKLDKRRKGVFGPPMGKVAVFFIDDLNMPALEKYGAQPPIELLRQWMDHHGWYDRKSIGAFKTLTDITFVCAMGPPGGGRNPITKRLTRHFNVLAFAEMSDDSKRNILKPILGAFLQTFENGALLTSSIVDSTIAVYNKIAEELLPTPAKVHYTFNLRDLSKVFQGMLMVDLQRVEDKTSLVRLWVHECSRVFKDRLINNEDRTWFLSLMQKQAQAAFDLTWDAVMPYEPVLYGDFSDPSADPKKYFELPDTKKIKQVMDEALDDYNAATTSSQMRLVLFQDAIEHAARISRIIRQPLGNALLLGVGGSGRQSMTRLAASMADYECFQIELSKNYGVTEWRDDLKKVLKKAGLENKQMVFLFSDTQIKSESFLEDINNILNSGDVPGIYDPSEQDEIFNCMKPVVQASGLNPTKSNLMSRYCMRVRSNVHCVICMSPIGEIFRARLRQFPALVNCCTIDWFSEWPDEALRSVANALLGDTDLDDPALVNGLVESFVDVHQSVVTTSVRFKQQLGRMNYVTPTAYLELIGTFTKLMKKKKAELVKLRTRTATGLEKLLATAAEVAQLQEELTAMQPMLKDAAEQTELTMVKITEDKAVAQVTATQVSKEEKEASDKTAETKEIADDAQRDLDEALPALDAALASLKSLNKNDITEVKAMQNPPIGVKLVMEAVCIMQNVKPKMVAGEKMGTKVADYWSVCGPLLQNPQKFLDSLFSYDRDHIPDSVIQKIQPYIDNADFTPAAISKVSRACTSICSWVRAMHKYHFVARAVEPKRESLRMAQESLQQTQRQLADAKGRLKQVQERIAEMESKFAAMVVKKKQLEDKATECTLKLARAKKLIDLLGDERQRWSDSVGRFDKLISNVVGDMVVAAGSIAYQGPFTAEFRSDLSSRWRATLTRLSVPHTDMTDLVSSLSDPVQVREWQIHGLPRDAMSVENAGIVSHSSRWPLFIDPQAQANRWIKQMESDKLVVMKLTDRDFLRSLENAVRFGSPCLLENVGMELDPALEPILLRQTFKQAGSTVIRLGDSVIPYHDDFKFYVTTKLPNPLYTPEVSTKVVVINFTLSPSGLEDQMLGLVVARERPDLEEAKNALIVNNAKMKSELKEIEDKILNLLSESKGSPVDDENLIEALDASKIKSAEIQAKVQIAEETERDIDSTRSKYVPVAVRTQLLFFCTTDLARVDPMYQYSLEWFRAIFLNSIEKAELSDDVLQRTQNINSHFTFNLYSNVCRSLFERHKLLFSFLLCCRILMNQNKIDPAQWRFLVSSGSATEVLENPASEWLSERAWQEFLNLSALPHFHSFAKDFKANVAEYKRIFDSTQPHREPLPAPWDTNLDPFQKLLVLRCIRFDMMAPMLQDFVALNLGQRFIEPQTTNLAVAYADSSPSVPLIFVLSPGTDPAADLYKFADEMKFSKKLSAISLGQGQGPRAEAMLKSGMERGTWVFFQNCHLAPSWMPTLERLIENIDPGKVHRDFRLWLTSVPSPKFPVSILQNSAKMTVEPPRGIKANLLEAFSSFDDNYLNACTKPDAFRKLVLSLCMFHGVLLERRKFGSLGFNIRYPFNKSDLHMCLKQLSMFLDDSEDVPFKVLVYTAGQINYGGRVTDDWDRRCQMTVLEGFYNVDALGDAHPYSPSGIYHQLPSGTDYAGHMDFIKGLPINDTPEIFGLHDNANITFANNETSDLLASLLATGGGGGGGSGGGSGGAGGAGAGGAGGASGGDSRDKVIEDLANDILSKLPKVMSLDDVISRHPVRYEESMNTVLIQEVIRFNKLLSAMHSSLRDLIKAIKGLVVMSEALELMANSLYVNQVPALWAAKAYPSLKPLGAWVIDLLARVEFIQNWNKNGIPPSFWISGFYFPQAFLTGTLQNYARKHVVSIDTLAFDFDVLNRPVSELRTRPTDGCYVYGLYLEGARWDASKGRLEESKAKELYTEMAPMWFRPVVSRKTPESGVYECPCYKTLQRAGVLSTTGHSTNFVLPIEVPTHMTPSHWIKRAVALICALDY